MSRTTDVVIGFGLGFLAFTELGNQLTKKGISAGSQYMKPYLNNMGLFTKNSVDVPVKPTTQPTATVVPVVHKENTECTL